MARTRCINAVLYVSSLDETSSLIAPYTDAMNTTYPLAAMGDPARAAILVALLDRRATTAGDLALLANVSAQFPAAISPSSSLADCLPFAAFMLSQTTRIR